MPSPATQGSLQAPQYLYYYIEQGSPERFGQELTKALNRIRQRHGDVLHISTQIMHGPDGAARAWTGQIIFAVAAAPGDFANGQRDRGHDLAHALPGLLITWPDEPAGC